MTGFYRVLGDEFWAELMRLVELVAKRLECVRLAGAFRGGQATESGMIERVIYTPV
jgi:hypothetical protein